MWAVAVLCALLAAAAGVGQWLVIENLEPDPDAILVLARHESERFPRAWQLALQHPRATVLLSSPAAPTPFNCQACAHRVGWLIGWGIPQSRILVMEAPVRNSYDELLTAKRLARQRGWSSIQVVTSPYHTRRVVGLARVLSDEGTGPSFGVTGASSVQVRPRLWWSRRYDGRYVGYEMAALVANGWRYGIWPWQWTLSGD